MFATLLALLLAADQPTVRATIEPVPGRKPAPEIALRDAHGKSISLRKYRGKVVLLDFWATWCHGCKQELPWFADFERRFAKQGLVVVGVSLDEDGWKVVTPFLKSANLPYKIVLGDDETARKYNIGDMPEAFLIDRHGRIAATYVGLVDRVNIESNLRALLADALQ